MMGIQFPQKEPSNTRVQATNGKIWITLGPNPKTQANSGEITSGLSQTKLLFNEAIPARAYNRATHICPPAPILIEKLASPQFEEEKNMSSNRSSLSFSVLSEERLLAAVKLAKRDLRRKHHESLKSSLFKTSSEKSLKGASYVDFHQQEEDNIEKKFQTSSPKEKPTRTRAKLVVHTTQKLSSNLSPVDGLSPPTRESGREQLARSRIPQLNKEICKLQNELEVFIQKIEKLASMGHMSEDPLEPDEQHKVVVRRQKQAARSAQIIYVLQQQVKEIQKDLERLHSQKNNDTRKSKAIDRLAAAHRGAVRAIQIFIHQLSEPHDDKLPSHYKEMGQLIRQLSLCSAKIEVDQGSALPETALDILQKLETLDLALSKQERLRQRQAQARSSSPPQRKSPHRSLSPPYAAGGPTTSSLRGPRKPAALKRGICGRRVASQKVRGVHSQHVERRQVLRAGLESIVQQRELREGINAGSRPKIIQRKQMGLHTQWSKTRGVGFQQPTVSSQLRVNQLPRKEHSAPWIPTSPHSPPLQRASPQRRPEPRCLFSPLNPSASPQRHKTFAGQGTKHIPGIDKRKKAQNEALRQAWLDNMTLQRLKDVNQMSTEEKEPIQRSRSETESHTEWTERGGEQNTRSRIQPHLDQIEIGESRSRKNSSPRHRLPEQTAERTAESAEQLSEALLEDLLDDAARAVWVAETDRQLEGMAQCSLQAPTLESMLLRMEEMQRDQEEVRRRITSIVYSDPLYWDKVDRRGPQCHAIGSLPASPQPIRLTRPLVTHSPAADIVLERPVETGILSESSLTEEASRDDQQPSNGTLFPGPTNRNRGRLISVPSSTLGNIRQYRDKHDAFLRLVAHEPIGGFNPWAIADSLAEELMSEALADVAAEFQNVCEEYAEAVFTSEFLKPSQSPTASVPPLGSQ